MTTALLVQLPDGSPAPAPAVRTRERTAVVALFLLGLNATASVELGTALVVGLALIPVWAPAVRHFRGATTLLVLAVASIVSGWVLVLSSTDRDVDLRNAIAVSLQVAAAFAGVGLILWARRVVPLHRIGLAYGVGALIAGALKSPGSENAWKYELAVPVTMVVLSLVAGRSRRLLAVALGLLAVVGVVNDHRSYLGFCVATLGLVLWQARPDRGRRVGAPLQVLALAVCAFVVYQLGTALLLSGALGYDLQQRTVTQIRSGGSLILGGRPEWEATAKLIRAFPGGFGVGAVPRSGDVSLAKQGLIKVGIPTKNGYVDRFMFGGQFKLHSVAADLWSNFGVVGLVFAVALGLTLLLALTSAMADRGAGALVVFLALNSLWNLAFGPLYSSLPDLVPALGLLLLARTPPRGTARDHPPPGEEAGPHPQAPVPLPSP